mgnify:CR=1 FL=1
MDFATRFTIWMLYLVEYANWNSQATIGYGCGNSGQSAGLAMGYTDSMPYHTGTTQSSRTTYGLGTQYRHIEGLWDNVYDRLTGCYYNSSGMNITLNPANFAENSGGTLIGKPSSGYPSAFTAVDASGTFPMFYASAASGGSETTYSCDSWYYNSSVPVICVGGNWNQNGNHGLFYVNYTNTSNTNANHGSRFLLDRLANTFLVCFAVLAAFAYIGTGSRAPLGEDKPIGNGSVHAFGRVGKTVRLKGGIQNPYETRRQYMGKTHIRRKSQPCH